MTAAYNHGAAAHLVGQRVRVKLGPCRDFEGTVQSAGVHYAVLQLDDGGSLTVLLDDVEFTNALWRLAKVQSGPPQVEQAPGVNL